MKKHTIIPREDHSRHAGPGEVIHSLWSKEKIDEHFSNIKIKVNEKEYKQRNYLRYHKAPMREPTLEDQMSIYDLEGVR